MGAAMSGKSVADHDDLVLTHLGLARGLAARFAGRGEDIDDLRQVATLALIHSAQRYDPERGVKFASYATPVIVGEIKRHFRDKRWSVHVPRREQEVYLRVRDALEELSAELCRSPTAAEIADRAGATVGEVLLAQELVTLFALPSLDDPKAVADGRPSVRTDPVDWESSFDLVESRASIVPALEALSERERELIVLRFRDGLSQSEIAERLGVSQMQVSRLLASILARLRSAIGD